MRSFSPSSFHKIRTWIDLKGFVFALFLSAGRFKADPRLAWLSVDLTLLCACLTILLVFWAFFKNGLKVQKNMLWIGLLYILFLVPVFWTEWSSYSEHKVVRLFSLTFLASLAPFFLFKTKEDIFRFLNSLAFLGLLHGISALNVLLTSNADMPQLSAPGSTTISLGRSVGMSLIWFAILALERRIRVATCVSMLGVLGILLIASGSRGPLLAVLGAFILPGFLFYWKNLISLLRFLGVAILGSAVMAYGLSVAPESSTQRIEYFLQGNLNDSELIRIEAYTLSWEKIQDHVWGIGWGGFATKINPWIGEERQYPHNILLEILLEGGWVAGLYFSALLLSALLRILSKHSTLESRALFAILIFFMLNAMVSGDLNDNKELFAFLSLSLAYRGESCSNEQKRTFQQE